MSAALKSFNIPALICAIVCPSASKLASNSQYSSRLFAASGGRPAKYASRRSNSSGVNIVSKQSSHVCTSSSHLHCCCYCLYIQI